MALYMWKILVLAVLFQASMAFVSLYFSGDMPGGVLGTGTGQQYNMTTVNGQLLGTPANRTDMGMDIGVITPSDTTESNTGILAMLIGPIANVITFGGVDQMLASIIGFPTICSYVVGIFSLGSWAVITYEVANFARGFLG